MFCPNCGDKIEHNGLYCSKCGKLLGNRQYGQYNRYNSFTPINQSTISNTQYYNYQQGVPSNKSNGKKVFWGLGIGLGVLALMFVGAIMMNSGEEYYFSFDSRDNTERVEKSEKNEQNEKDEEEVPINNNTITRTNKYSTVIITDNKYSGVKISTSKDAYDLIVKDSVIQKGSCSSEIKKIENDIIKKYGITAVNLCEMDVDFAKEISNVLGKIYEEFPSARGYLTNISLINAPLSDGYIAAFSPIFTFATSNSSSTYPWVIKTQVLLNTSYFLNPSRLEAAVKDGSNSGHFPPNTTIYSPIAHEFGHYLSFIAMMKHYRLDSILMVDKNNVDTVIDVSNDFSDDKYSLEMITEAYNKYKRKVGTTLDIDSWRGQISDYAVARDNNGDYIYDETIAEAFHDVYLNGENANIVSKYIVDVLKSKLES